MLGKQFSFCLLSLYDGVCLAHLSYYSAMVSLVYFYGFNEELAYFVCTQRIVSVAQW